MRHNNLRQIDENDDSQSESDNSDEESNDWYPFLISNNQFFNNTYFYKSNSNSQVFKKDC